MVETHDIGAWCQSFLAALTRVADPNDAVALSQPEAIRRAMERLRQSMGASQQLQEPARKAVPWWSTYR